MADIITVKKELYNKLKVDNRVIGAGIKGSGKAEHIVIFVTKQTHKITGIVPSTFKGIKVTTEVKQSPKAVNA